MIETDMPKLPVDIPRFLAMVMHKYSGLREAFYPSRVELILPALWAEEPYTKLTQVCGLTVRYGGVTTPSLGLPLDD